MKPPIVTVSEATVPVTEPDPYKMVISGFDELAVGATLNVDDFEVSKTGDPTVQLRQVETGNHKSEDPVSRTTSNDWGL